MEEQDGYATAPVVMLNPTSLLAVEMPGPVQETSLPKVLTMLGGPRRLTSVLDSFKEAPNAVTSVPELHLRPENVFAHPVTGSIVETSNLLLKVVRRRRKIRRTSPPEVNDGLETEQGVFTVESVGIINRSIRFRDMQDFQYQPEMDDDIVRLTNAMRNLDVPPLLQYAFPEPGEVHPDHMRLFPPAVFSRTSLPQHYGFKRNPQSRVEVVTNAQGDEVERLRNSTRYALVPPQTISFADPNTPDKPAEGVKEGPGTEASLIARYNELFSERPVWGRQALLNQLSLDHYRVTVYQKQALPFLTYTFNDGPFREMVCKLGYDPRQDPTARFYQRIQLRNTLAVKSSKRDTVMPGSHAHTGAIDDPRGDVRSHIFDGAHCLPMHPGTYQLIDLTDPLLHELVHDSHFFRTTCHPVDGWFVPDFFEHLRHILKQKFTTLVTTGQPIDEDELSSDVERMRQLPREDALAAATAVNDSDSEDGGGSGGKSDSDAGSGGGGAGKTPAPGRRKSTVRAIKKTKKPTAKRVERDRRRPIELLGKAATTIEDEEGTPDREASMSAAPAGPSQSGDMQGVEFS